MGSLHGIFFIQLILLVLFAEYSMNLVYDKDKMNLKKTTDGIKNLEDIPHTNKVKKSVAVKDRNQLWPSGVIHYEIEEIFSGPQLRMIKLGMLIWEESTCIKFVERKQNIQDYINITKTDCGCCYIENKLRNKGRSELSFDDGCEKIPIILHELGHVIGFYHEHEHPDRDQYVQINEHNVEQGHRVEFGKFAHHEVDTLGQPYDYQSIMHYPKNAFARYDFMETIVPLQLDNGKFPVIGNKIRLSDSDIAATNNLYNCSTCGGFLTASYGEFQLLNHTNGYCEWQIRASHGERIYFGIKSSDFQATPNCSIEYLEIKKGFDNSKDSVLDRYCGGEKYEVWRLVPDSIVISYYRKNFEGTSSDLKVTYKKVCEGEIFVFNNKTSYLESPNYPKNYEPNKDCFWYLVAPKDHTIEITFDLFSLEYSEDCTKDFIEISDVTEDSQIQTYCGSKNPWTVTLTKNYAYLRFFSDNSEEAAGFSASIIAV